MLKETTQDLSNAKLAAMETTDWEEIIGALCEILDLSRPVMLRKHFQDLRNFSHVCFKPLDFIEPVDFLRFEVVVFAEAKK